MEGARPRRALPAARLPPTSPQLSPPFVSAPSPWVLCATPTGFSENLLFY